MMVGKLFVNTALARTREVRFDSDVNGLSVCSSPQSVRVSRPIGPSQANSLAERLFLPFCSCYSPQFFDKLFDFLSSFGSLAV